MSQSAVIMAVTPDNQQLTALRHQAFDNLLRVRGRSLKAADISKVTAGDQVTLIFQEQPILTPVSYTHLTLPTILLV